jgi:hypothetical protein
MKEIVLKSMGKCLCMWWAAISIMSLLPMVGFAFWLLWVTATIWPHLEDPLELYNHFTRVQLLMFYVTPLLALNWRLFTYFFTVQFSGPRTLGYVITRRGHDRAYDKFTIN